MSIASVLSGVAGAAPSAAVYIGGGVCPLPFPSARIAAIPAADAAFLMASSTSSIEWNRQDGCFSRHFITSDSTSRGRSISGRTDRIGAGGSFICLKMTSIESLATNGGRPTNM